MNFESQVLQIPIEDIVPNRFQPRSFFDDSSLTDLAESIKQHGLIQPIVARKTGDKYEIIAGERRYRAAKMAGFTSLPVVVANIDDKTSAEVAVAENVQRSQLNSIDEARSYKTILDQGYMDKEQLAKKMGISILAVENKLKLLSLTPEVQDAIVNCQISERHGKSLLQVDASKQKDLLNKIINERLTVKQLDDLITKTKGDNMNNEMPIPQNITPVAPPNGNFTMGPIDLGTNNTGKFFNRLENEAANMQMTEAINPLSINEVPITEINTVPSSNEISANSEIETLDTLDVPSSISTDSIKLRFQDLVSEFQAQNIPISLNVSESDTDTTISIVIQK